MIKLKYKRETLLSINGQTSDYMTIRNIFSGNPMMIFLSSISFRLFDQIGISYEDLMLYEIFSSNPMKDFLIWIKMKSFFD